MAAQYRRMASRRSKQRAWLAVGHMILVIIYHLLQHHPEHKDLGRDHFDRLAPTASRVTWSNVERR